MLRAGGRWATVPENVLYKMALPSPKTLSGSPVVRTPNDLDRTVDTSGGEAPAPQYMTWNSVVCGPLLARPRLSDFPACASTLPSIRPDARTRVLRTADGEALDSEALAVAEEGPSIPCCENSCDPIKYQNSSDSLATMCARAEKYRSEYTAHPYQTSGVLSRCSPQNCSGNRGTSLAVFLC